MRSSTLPSVTLLGLWLICEGMWAPSQAMIRSFTGDFEGVTPADIVAAGGSIQQDDYESDTRVRVFLEKQDIGLTAPLSVDITISGIYGTPLTPGVLPAGLFVTSYLCHADPASPGTWHYLGILNFGVEILGIIVQDANLQTSDAVVGLTGDLAYPVRSGSTGLDFAGPNADVLIYDSVARTVQLNLTTIGFMDEVRIIVRGMSHGVGFGIDHHSFSDDGLASWGGTMTEDDIMTTGDAGPPGPNPPVLGPTVPPGVMFTGQDLRIQFPGMKGVREVDAISFGHDFGSRVLFSVDEFAKGRGGGVAPDVRFEGAIGRQEAAADLFVMRGPLAPVCGGFMFGNRRKLDGHGDPADAPGFFLWEPNAPVPHDTTEYGDNLDAFDIGMVHSDTTTSGRIYFSLDESFPDRLECPPGPPPNSGTAPANNVCGADILMITPGAPAFGLFANGAALGLQCVAGEGKDDIDALLVIDRGQTGVFERNVDRVYYSLRRGSDTVVSGVLDGLCGLPITESDILRPGQGASPFPPEIVVPGEVMGLYACRGCPPDSMRDDLDALDAILVAGVPVGNPDLGQVSPGGNIILDVLGNDAALRGHLVPSSVTIVIEPQFGIISRIDQATGAVTYSNTDPSQTEDAFGYIVYDDDDNVSEVCMVTIAILPNIGVDDAQLARGKLIAFASPSPFRDHISFWVRTLQGGPTLVEVFGPDGERVRSLLHQGLSAGECRAVLWDGRNDRGQQVTAGVYYVRVTAPEGRQQLQVVRCR